jgi:hypothetical protein
MNRIFIQYTICYTAVLVELLKNRVNESSLEQEVEEDAFGYRWGRESCRAICARLSSSYSTILYVINNNLSRTYLNSICPIERYDVFVFLAVSRSSGFSFKRVRMRAYNKDPFDNRGPRVGGFGCPGVPAKTTKTTKVPNLA